MGNEDGYNKLNHDCSVQGCFNIVKRPKIEKFHKIFDKKINFGDIDSIVEINGRFLIVEYKSWGTELKVGQRIMYQRMTRHKEFTVFIVEANCETMEIYSFSQFKNGTLSKQVPCNFDQLYREIEIWHWHAIHDDWKCLERAPKCPTSMLH